MVDVTAVDHIGLDYRINLAKLATTIKGAKKQLAKFHKDLASLSKKASITITIHDKKAKAKVKQFTNAMQATLDKTGRLQLKAVTEPFAKMGGAVPRMTKDYEKLYGTFRQSPVLLGKMNASFKRVNSAIGEQALRMQSAGRNGIAYYKTANRVKLVQQELKGTLKATATGFRNITRETQKAEVAKKKAATEKAYTRKLREEAMAVDRLAKAQAKTAKTVVAVSPSAELEKMGITSATTTKQFHKMNLAVADHAKIATLTRQQIKTLRSEMASSGKATATQAHQFNRLGKRLEHSEYQVRQQTNAMGDARRAQERWGAGFKHMMLSQTAWIASGAVIFGTLGAITQGIKDVIAYHQKLKGLEAITAANAKEMEMMASAIRDAAVGTKFFAADMAEAATIMAQAGLSAKEISKAIGPVALLASATGRELKDVADLMTTVMRAYNLHASEALRIANVLAAGISESKLQVDKLKTAMNYMGVAAYQFNISIEDTVAWLGVLSDRGLKASTIGTSFRGVLAVLTQSTDKFNRVLSKLPDPLGFSDITIRRGRKLEDSLRRLAAAGFKVTDAFSGTQRRVAMTLSLMIENVKAWDKLKDSITGTNRAVEMNKTMMEGLDSQLKQIKSIFDEIAIAATRSGGALEGVVAIIKKVIQILGMGIVTMTTFADLVPKAIASFGAIGTIKWKKLIVGDLKGATAEALAIYKGYRKDIDKTLEKYLEFGGRVLGAGGLFGAGTVESEDVKNLKTLIELNKEKDLLIGKMEQIEKQAGRGSKAWQDLQGQLYMVTFQMDELIKKAGLSVDAIAGPVSTLKSIMLDMVISATMSAEELLSVFRKGTDDVEFLKKAVKRLEEEYLEAHKVWSYVGSKDSAQYERMIKLAERLVVAKKKLTNIEKKRDKDIEKIFKADKKVAELLIKIKDKYYDKEFEYRKIAKKNALSDAEFKKWLADEEFKVEEKKLADLIKSYETYYANLNSMASDLSLEGIAELPKIAKVIDELKRLKPTRKEEPDPTDYSKGIIDGLKDVGKELSNEYKIWKDLTMNVAHSMSDTLSDVFFDSMTGQLRSAGDYWKAFTTSVKRMIADMAAKWVMLQAFGGAAKGIDWIGTALSVASLGGGGGTSPSVSGGPSGVGPIGSGITSVHSGGLIKMHDGGLASNETLRILKNNEYVIKDSSVRSIGVAALNQANQTGRLPQTQPQQVIHKHYNYIYAIDSESMDVALRKRGAGAISDISLNAGAYARERRDPRAGRRY